MFKIWNIVQLWIDRTVMYVVVLYSLLALFVCSLILSLLGLVYYSFWSQIISLLIAVFVSYSLSIIFAKLFNVSANHPSSVITAMIIMFLVNPVTSFLEAGVLTLAIFIALLSKYVIVYRGQHILNPAALGVFILGLTGYGYAIWWVATSYLIIPTLIAGAVVVTKIRRWVPVLAFLISGFAVYLFETWRFGGDLYSSWSDFFFIYPALFLAFYMLTEPFSMPPNRRTQIFYGVIVGGLFSTYLFKSLFIMTPEIALLIGNLAVYGFTLRRKLKLKFIKMTAIAEDTYEFVFEKTAGFKFTAGQYLEWMLPHEKTDARGIRRYFTIASAPTENVIRLALKIPESGSTFKKALKSLKVGDNITASQLAGDFILPKTIGAKIALVAGGIGVTPFRSQVKNLLDLEEKRDTILFYCNNKKEDVAYARLFAEAQEKMPFKTVYVLAKEEPAATYETGYLSAEIIKKNAPDLLTRTWFISGPPMMVSEAVKILKSLGVKRGNIIKDFFPGLA